MSVVLMKAYDIQGQYETLDERNKMISMIDSLRLWLADDKAELNLINGKKLQYTDRDITSRLNEGLKDLNRGTPRTTFSLFSFPDPDLVVRAAMIMSLVAEGILQLRNRIDYSDSGFTIAMFNKSESYQQWASFLLQTYIMDKKDFKSGIIPSSYNSGFYGVGSPFSYQTR